MCLLCRVEGGIRELITRLRIFMILVQGKELSIFCFSVGICICIWESGINLPREDKDLVLN